jgi:RNA polymerase sigma-70 factor (ECF subfamily)
MATIADYEIIRLILQGDRNKFRILVEKYQPLVFRTCMGFVHNKDDADDLTQEIFIQVFRSLQSFKGKSSLSTWIYRIALNASLNKVRKSSGNQILQRLDTLFGTGVEKRISFPVYDPDDPESILISQEHKEWVKNALDSLPEKQRTAIILSNYDDLTQKEIAEIMNTTEGAVEALIQRAKKNLRVKLSSGRKKSKQP